MRDFLIGDVGDWTSLGAESITSRNVSHLTAMQVTAVYACIRILAETIASLPFFIYKRLPGGGKEKATDHSLYTLLHDAPNPEITSLEFREAMMGHVALRGNSYAEIERNNGGKAVGLWPIHPNNVTVKRSIDPPFLLYYKVMVNGRSVILREDQVLHIRGLSSNGIIGYDPITIARESIGLALAQEEYASRLFSNNARPGGVIEHPNELKDASAKRLKASWEAQHRGLEKSHRVAVLEEGMKWKEISFSPENAQFMEARRFQTEEIAQLFRIPVSMLANLKQPTFASVEQFSIDFVVHTIRPWLVRWEQAIKRSLFTEADKRIYYPEIVVDALLRGDIKTRYEAYAIARGNGWMSANDIRSLENMNPLPGDQGDVYLIPLNMVPAQFVTEQPGISEAKALTSGMESRVKKSVAWRYKIRQRFIPLIEDAARRVVKREIADIKRAVKRIFKTRSIEDFNAWLEEYYSENFVNYAQLNMAPVYQAYAEMIEEPAAIEAGQEPAGMTPEFQQEVNRYTNNWMARYSGSSAGQLRQVARDAITDEADVVAVIDTRLDEWEERRPAKVAGRESVQAEGAFAKAIWIAAGIMTVTWIAHGESCPYCNALNGRTIGIMSTFLKQGEELDPTGADGTPLTTYGSISYPPAHQGCDCSTGIGG